MYKNTILCCDLKTILSSDRIMKAAKDYTGILRREVDIDELRYDEHFTFVETLPWTMKRNPRVYAGKHITVTRRDDGTLRLNFRPVKMGYDFSIDGYAIAVCNELREALNGLVESAQRNRPYCALHKNTHFCPFVQSAKKVALTSWKVGDFFIPLT